jgi:hypothetical protein
LFRVLNLRRFSVLLLLFSAIIFCTLQSFANNFLYSEAQILPQQPSFQPPLGVKITSHVTGQKVPTGELTISGTSTDTPNTECQVYTDLNDKKPMQKVKAIGPGGNNDYSKWTFIYTSTYDLIQNGTNNLTSKISCIDSPTTGNLTKWNSVNVTGVDGLAGIPQPSITNVVGNTTNSTDTVVSQSLAQTPPPLITPPLQPADIVDNSNDNNQGQNNEDEDEDNNEDDRTVRLDTEEDEDEDEDSTQVGNSQDEDEADNNDDEDNREEDTSDNDGDDCGIGDDGFPFCDGRPGEDDFDGGDDRDDCGIGDEGFPFC